MPLVFPLVDEGIALRVVNLRETFELVWITGDESSSTEEGGVLS